jgi:hypothetical protein
VCPVPRPLRRTSIFPENKNMDVDHQDHGAGAGAGAGGAPPLFEGLSPADAAALQEQQRLIAQEAAGKLQKARLRAERKAERDAANALEQGDADGASLLSHLPVGACVGVCVGVPDMH